MFSLKTKDLCVTKPTTAYQYEPLIYRYFAFSGDTGDKKTYAFAAFAFLMPCRPPLCACDFVLVHPPGTHTKTSTSRGLPKMSEKSSGTCFKEQQRQVGQRSVPSVSM